MKKQPLTTKQRRQRYRPRWIDECSDRLRQEWEARLARDEKPEKISFPKKFTN